MHLIIISTVLKKAKDEIESDQRNAVRSFDEILVVSPHDCSHYLNQAFGSGKRYVK